LIVGRSQHKTLMDCYEYLKQLRARYITVASTINAEAKKTRADREMEFALYIVAQGLKSLAKQRAALPDRKLKQRINSPTWQEVDEQPLGDEPAVILKQRKEFTRSLNLETILTIIRRTYS
jgi:hypothetical protein